MVAAGAAKETLHEIALTPPWSLDVLGSDISPVMLVQARNGIYGTGSLSAFRVTPRPVLRFFPPAEGEAGNPNPTGRQRIRRHVRFPQGDPVQARPQARVLDSGAVPTVV